MNEQLAKIADRLAERFAALPLSTVSHVVEACAADVPEADPSADQHDAARKLAALAQNADSDPAPP